MLVHYTTGLTQIDKITILKLNNNFNAQRSKHAINVNIFIVAAIAACIKLAVQAEGEAGSDETLTESFSSFFLYVLQSLKVMRRKLKVAVCGLARQEPLWPPSFLYTLSV